jgi:hypothetical protein
VVALPAVVLAVAWWADRVRWARLGVVVAGGLSAVTWAWLLADVRARRVALIVDFAGTDAPTFRAWRHLLPDGAALGPGDIAGFAGWLVALAALALAGWHSVRPSPSPPAAGSTARASSVVASRLGPSDLGPSDLGPSDLGPSDLRHASLTPGGSP